MTPGQNSKSRSPIDPHPLSLIHLRTSVAVALFGGTQIQLFLLNLIMEIADMPKNTELAQLVAQIIRKNGGVTTNEQIRAEVITSLGLSDGAVSTIHAGNRTEIEYRLAWARTIAKKKNLIKSVGPKQWSSVE